MLENLISVILPVYNAENSIAQAVQSILSQENCEMEIIIIDNNSTDNTSKILHELAAIDLRIKLLFEERQGISFALNTGLRQSKGKYIARMDADDISLINRLSKQAKFLDENPDIGLVSGLVEYVGNADNYQGFYEYVQQVNAWKTNEEFYTYRFIESAFAHPSVMFRKSLIDDFGFYTENKMPEDYELWLRWMQHGVKFAKLDEYVLQWTDSNDRLSRTHENCTTQAIDDLRYHYLSKWLMENKAQLKPLYVWGGGKLANQKMKRVQEMTGIPVCGIIDLKEIKTKEIPHIFYQNLPPKGEIFILSLVSNRGKYLEVEAFLKSRGYVCGENFMLSQ